MEHRMPDPAHILEKYPKPVPRYTSYPAAPHFRDGQGQPLMKQLLAGLDAHTPVSVYAHIPFCDKLCWFCGCHTRHTLKHAPIEAYIGSLEQEIALLAQHTGQRTPVAQLHLGGGSPSLLTPHDCTRIRTALEGAFTFSPGSEISVEIDPSDVTAQTLEAMQIIGLTRASIGVQDFDETVQRAINRPQSFELTRDVAAQLRQAGIGSLNIDALYGLPLQTRDRLAKTIEKVISIAPDRVALFGYAHVPWMKKHQQMIREDDLPGALERFEQAEMAAAMLCEAGYERIGIDHFAKPADPLAQAARQGRLHRNFQGYVTDSCETLIGLGASSIGRFAGGYVQNIVATGQYQTAVANAHLPAAKGLALTQDDHVRGWMIERLMCDFEIRFDALQARFGSVASGYVEEARSIAATETDGLCEADADGFRIPHDARAFTRIVAARLDAYLNASGARYSRAV
jgi:oxygen-independent coproporphyrinogen-3 oxidase